MADARAARMADEWPLGWRTSGRSDGGQASHLIVTATTPIGHLMKDEMEFLKVYFPIN